MEDFKVIDPENQKQIKSRFVFQSTYFVKIQNIYEILKNKLFI